MIFRTIPETKRGIKTSSGGNIRPFVETKMPLAYQVSCVTCVKETIACYDSGLQLSAEDEDVTKTGNEEAMNRPEEREKFKNCSFSLFK